MHSNLEYGGWLVCALPIFTVLFDRLLNSAVFNCFTELVAQATEYTSLVFIVDINRIFLFQVAT